MDYTHTYIRKKKTYDLVSKGLSVSPTLLIKSEFFTSVSFDQ